ncbi:MAG: DUF3899 domain-containing protein [Clostridia bacterium]|nr:DUF3899 domain-containing protein [Clostridia bacterium]MBR2985823.1 DUF3899 domain-containing protein [Clostridia bacterium]
MKKWLQYLIIAGVNLLLVLGVMLIQEGFEQSGEELLKVLCNAFFVPGMCTLGIGVLIWSTNGGTFDMIAFGFVKLFDLFKKDLTKVKYKTFYDYRKAQQEKKRSFSAYLVVGAVFMAVSILFLVLYNNY